ncbi:hypothetical protein ABT063_38355 [Streptomyces sp. NPDC002838]|uniref:hypothetical protein n=1 Tax=Streptomyces sp. NPDC002838 TaxID=3154436 RepID=UPI003326B3FC
MGGYATGLFPAGTTATTPDPATAAPVIMELAGIPDPPQRLIVGSRSFDAVLEMDRARAEQYRASESLSRTAPG